MAKGVLITDDKHDDGNKSLDDELKQATIHKIKMETKLMRDDMDLKIAEIYAKIEAMRYDNAKHEAERAKLEKELKFYPWVAVGIPVALAIFAVFW